MPLTHYACANCGFWQLHFATPPDCPGLHGRAQRPAGGRLALPARGAGRRHPHPPSSPKSPTTCGRSPPPPRWGLAGTGWLLVRPEGNTAFEGSPFYDDAALDRIEGLGGVTWLSGSHAHGYGALWQLQRRFEPTLAIHKDDLAMTKAFAVTTPYDDAHPLAPGLTLHHVGGHYEGQAALHDKQGRRLFCGDMFKVDQDEGGRSHAISSHKAFHKDIPLTHGELRHYRDVIAPLEFDTILTPFEYAPEVDETWRCPSWTRPWRVPWA